MNLIHHLLHNKYENHPRCVCWVVRVVFRVTVGQVRAWSTLSTGNKRFRSNSFMSL